MTLSNDNYLPGDKRNLYSIFFNSHRSGFVSETVSGATQYASNILEPMKGYIERHNERGDRTKVGECVASGTVGAIDVDIILEEWTVGEGGCFDNPPMPFGTDMH